MNKVNYYIKRSNTVDEIRKFIESANEGSHVLDMEVDLRFTTAGSFYYVSLNFVGPDNRMAEGLFSHINEIVDTERMSPRSVKNDVSSAYPATSSQIPDPDGRFIKGFPSGGIRLLELL